MFIYKIEEGEKERRLGGMGGGGGVTEKQRFVSERIS
jgi:hypothetical protein